MVYFFLHREALSPLSSLLVGSLFTRGQLCIPFNFPVFVSRFIFRQGREGLFPVWKELLGTSLTVRSFRRKVCFKIEFFNPIFYFEVTGPGTRVRGRHLKVPFGACLQARS